MLPQRKKSLIYVSHASPSIHIACQPWLTLLRPGFLLCLANTSFTAYAPTAPSACNALPRCCHGSHASSRSLLKCTPQRGLPDPRLQTVRHIPTITLNSLPALSPWIPLAFPYFFVVCLPLESKPQEGRDMACLAPHHTPRPGSMLGTGHSSAGIKQVNVHCRVGPGPPSSLLRSPCSCRLTKSSRAAGL